MKADRQHFRRDLALGVERVEQILEIGVELIAGIEALRRRKSHVVGIERVRDHELRPARAFEPVGQVVGVGVGAIDKPALFHAQPDRVDRRTALIEAQRPCARDRGMDADRLRNMARLDVGWNVAIVDPFQTVGGDFPPRLVHRRNRFGIARNRGRDCIDGDRNRAVREQAVEAPEAGPGAIFVDRLHIHVAHSRPGRGADDLGQECFRRGVAVQDVVLAPLLVIDDELQGDARVVRPARVGRRAAVADHVARIGLAVRHAHLSPGPAWIAARPTLRQDRGLLQPSCFRAKVCNPLSRNS